ncbi:hypothetical protein M0R19_06230 [Candidatus Pacearchaeota archaeon]|nr:hypothetical protein [Candidatus Pacearchaeota archaeon]
MKLIETEAYIPRIMRKYEKIQSVIKPKIGMKVIHYATYLDGSTDTITEIMKDNCYVWLKNLGNKENITDVLLIPNLTIKEYNQLYYKVLINKTKKILTNIFSPTLWKWRLINLFNKFEKEW